jgi:predicted unusual protein kinase regulating ubiquinone biosynthesis (AarF/ABC1/UbiB family)
MRDEEANRLSARVARYARVGANVGAVAARIVGARLLRTEGADAEHAAALMQALGTLRGPMMKVAQMMATIPEVLPPAYAEALQKLQSEAPPMGAAFVKRRMQAELGQDWIRRFAAFDLHPAAAASLGQVHRAKGLDGTALACKLQYPDMASAVAADLAQLAVVFALHRRLDGVVDTRDITAEIGDRVREELDYVREARHAALYAFMLAPIGAVRVPATRPELSTGRLLTMDWLEGEKLLAFKAADEASRNTIATALFKAWWVPFSQFGVIHGDPHLGNYTVFREASDPRGRAEGINLLDYGCVRIFPARFVGGVVDLYEGLLHGDLARMVHAYETWGFRGLSRELVDILNIWARFIYGPLLDDRVRSIAEGTPPGKYGRKEAYRVHQALRQHDPVRIPREFVFMDRAAIGLGAVFLHLDARLNFHRLFNDALGSYRHDALAQRQAKALAAAGLTPPGDDSA